MADSVGMSVDEGERARTGLASAFGNPGLRKLYGAEVVSGVGEGIFWVSLVVFLSDQPRFGLWLTLAVVARLAPRAFLSLPAGSLVDRSSLRALIVSTELVRVVIMVGVTAVVALDGSPALVLVLTAVSYVVAAPIRPALSSIVPSLAGERHLAGANAVLSTLRQVMTFVGPLIGVAVAAWSSVVGIGLNAASIAVSGLLLAMVRGIPDRSKRARANRGRRSRANPVSASIDGVMAVRSISVLPPLVALIGVMSFVRGAEIVLYVYVVTDQLGDDVERVGLLSGAVGLGALLAMPIAARVADSVSPVRPIVFSLLVTAVPTAMLAVITTTLGASAVLVLVGVGMVVFEVVVVVTVQRITPPSALGRVFGAINGASNTGKLVGALVAPALVAALDVEVALIVVASVVVFAGAAVVWPLIRIGRVSAARQRELAPSVDVLRGLAIFEGASGPSLERIAGEMIERDFPAGAVVIAQGEPADDLYVSRAGALVATRDGVDVGTVSADDWFGEIGLIEERDRTATVTTVEPTTVWQIPGEVFLDALDDAGAAPSVILESMAERIASHQQSDQP